MAVVWVGFALFFVVSLVVGVRLLLLAARTRRAPELLIGLGVLGIGPVGFGLQTLASVLGGAHAAAESLAAAGATAAGAGVIAKLVFNWRIYRPQSAGARALAFTAIAATLFVLGYAAHTGFFASMRDATAYSLRGGLQVAALGWGATEALVYWLDMRRRVAFGLADRVVTNRFLLWGASAGAAALGTAIGVTATVATGQDALAMPAVLASSSLHGLFAAVAMWLAFVPPRRYVAWVGGQPAR